MFRKRRSRGKEKVRWDRGIRAQFREETIQSTGCAKLTSSLPVAMEVMLDHWSGLD